MGKSFVRKKPGIWGTVLLIYAGFVIIRSVMAFLTTAFPTVGIDEFLYSSLARSIAREGKLLYRGQPAAYNYLIYPLFLSPVYALFGQGANYYRIMQVWNAIVMNLSIFPLFSLCRETLKDEKKALWVSAVCMLLPDFLMNEFLFSEALIYPLFYLLVYLVYQMIRKPEVKLGIWIGLLGTILYYTKPGAIAMAAVALLYFLVRGLIRKNKTEILAAAAGVGSLGVSFLILWLTVRFIFGYEGHLLGMYNEQLTADEQIGMTFFWQTVGLYPYYFILACGILPMIAAVLFFPQWDGEHKQFFLLTMGSALVVMIGTAWAVNRSEYTRYLFMRYSDMYLPLVLIACLFPRRAEAEAGSETEAKPKRNVKHLIVPVILILYTLICTIAWGSTVGAGSSLDNHFMMSVASVMLSNISGISAILIFVLCGGSLFFIGWGPNKKVTAVFCASVFAVGCLLNNAAGYAISNSNASRTYGEEAYRTQTDLIRGDEYIYIFTNERVSDHGLNVLSRHSNQELELYDFFNNIHSHGGVYTPFVPVSERGMDSKVVTPDVNVLVAERTAYSLIKFSENVQGTMSSEDSFFVGRFETGARVVDAIIGNVENFKLLQTDYGVLTLYRDDWVGHNIRIVLEIESPVQQTMRFFADDAHSWNIGLEPGLNHYELLIENAAIGYNFVVSSDNIMVYGFDVTSLET